MDFQTFFGRFLLFRSIWAYTCTIPIQLSVIRWFFTYIMLKNVLQWDLSYNLCSCSVKTCETLQVKWHIALDTFMCGTRATTKCTSGSFLKTDMEMSLSITSDIISHSICSFCLLVHELCWRKNSISTSWNWNVFQIYEIILCYYCYQSGYCKCLVCWIKLWKFCYWMFILNLLASRKSSFIESVPTKQINWSSPYSNTKLK